MNIYIDEQYLCHVDDAPDRRLIETDFFDGKCKEFIEGYRYIPENESWTRTDGAVFEGLSIAAAEDYEILENAQIQYEIDLLLKNDMQTALSILGVTE